MNKIFSRVTAVALVTLATALTARAQYTQSGYFLDGYTYKYQMNPAEGNDRNFVAIPGIGNINVGMQGNLHVSDIFYNVNGKTTTFLNPGVSVSEAMSGFSDVNKIGTDIKVGILAGGFKAWGGYNTVSINARANVGASVPRSLFSLLKEGVSNSTYDISDIRATAKAYVELGLGHSRNITDKLRVGATLKFLIGGASAEARLRNSHLTLGTDDWSIVSDAEIRTNIKGYTYETDYNEHTKRDYVSGLDGSFDGINGFGMGIDLGATYRLNQDWKFSAALLDLGFISWSDTQLATTDGPKSFNTDKYTFGFDKNGENYCEDVWDNVRDDISMLYQLEDKGNVGGRTTALNATLNLGAEYTLPYYRDLTFGLMNTTRFAGSLTWTDFRLSANVAPCKIFSATANLAVGTYGAGFGWLANLHVTGYNFFIGMDHTLGKLAKQGLPLNSNAQVNLGMNILF